MPFEKVNIIKNDDLINMKELDKLGAGIGSIEMLNFGQSGLIFQTEKPSFDDQSKGTAWIPVYLLKEILVGLHKKKWNGSITIETNSGRKALYMVNGEITFAKSSVFDDRLGEVIYRNGKLTLDELANSAAQVTRSKKFGQVLIDSGLFSAASLWLSLKEQIYQIINSIFFEVSVGIELNDGDKPWTEVRFVKGVEEMIDECMSFGTMVRQYKSRINEDTQVTFESKDEAFSIYKEGTYYGDLLREINDNPNVSSLIINSRVQKMYTIVALLSLTSKRLCSVANLSEASAVVDPNLWRLKNKVSLLRTIMVEAVAAFGKVGLHFPIKGLNELVVSLDGAESVIMLDKKGCLEIESVVRIMTLASSSSTKMSHYEAVLDSLIKLSLQISMDNLNPNELEQITNVYRIFSQHEANPTEKKFTQRRY